MHHRPNHQGGQRGFDRIGGSKPKSVPGEILSDFEITLPPLPVQRKIVAAWEAARKYAATTAAKIDQLEREIEARFLADLGFKAPAQTTFPKAFAIPFSQIERWGVDYNQQLATRLNPATGKYPVVGLADVIEDLENGWSPKCLDRAPPEMENGLC